MSSASDHKDEALSVTPASALEFDAEAKIKADENASEKDKESQRLSQSVTEKSKSTDSDSNSRPPSSKSTAQESHDGDSYRSRPPSQGSKRQESREQRPHSSESSTRPKSSSSGEVIFTAKRKRKSKGPLSPDAHTVTFTITIAQALPSGVKESDSDSESTISSLSQTSRQPSCFSRRPSCMSLNSPSKATLKEEDGSMPDVKDLMKKKKRVFEAPRAQNYYHLEYYLLPDDEDAVKTDVVTYGVAAKIYMERHDPRVLKTWQDGDITWVAWSHSHSITVTKDVLLQLFNHTLELRIWDAKDKCSTRARFDRPKAFRIPQPRAGEDPDELGGVKSQVLKQCRSFAKMQPKKSCSVRPLPSQITFQKDSSKTPNNNRDEDDVRKDLSPLEKKAIPQNNQLSPLKTPGTAASQMPHSLLSMRKEKNDMDNLGQELRSFSRLGHLAGTDQESPSTAQQSRNNGPQSNRSSQNKSHGPESTSRQTRSRESEGATTRARVTPSHDSPHVSTNSPHRPVSQQQQRLGSQQQQHRLGSQHQGADSQQAPKSAVESDFSLPGLEKGMITPKEKEKSPISRRKPKPDVGALSAAENVKKHGICVVPVRMAILFTGSRSITCRLENPVAGVEDVFISVGLDKPLMSEQQKRELNPLILKIHSASNMPDAPMTYDELRERCCPVYCKYKLYKQPEHISSGKEHASSIYWDDINVCLTGVLEPSEFRQFLNGPALEIAIHDRDRRQESLKAKPTIFGDDLEDEKINNVGTVTSRRTLHNPFQARDKPWDPYGLAKLDLSELLLGNRFLNLNVPIHSCKPPDILGLTDKPGARLVGIPGAVDGPVSQPLPAGQFMESNSMLKVVVELAFPLATPDDIAAKKNIESTFECPFGRLVFKFAYKNTSLLQKLQAVVTTINARALGLDDMPQHVIDAALSTYKLSIEQQRGRELDIVTGFQVMDGMLHLFVLEGLRDKGIRRIWEALPQPENEDVMVLYNSDYTFSERLYGPLDVDLCRIKLHEPLQTIIQQPLLYIRDMVPKPCFQSLVKLEELLRVVRMRDAVRNSLFPTAEMVVSMSKEFGVPLTAKDFQELAPKNEVVVRHDSPVAVTSAAFPHPSRDWTPIDHYNLTYVGQKLTREQTGISHNFISENINDVKLASNFNKCRREKTMPITVHADVKTAHNYSSQTLNSTELAKEKLRQQIAQSSDTLFTYCPEYHHSMTVIPVNVDALRKQAIEESEAAWKTEKGWTYPGMKTAMECNYHHKHPDPAREDELTDTWRDNILHANILQPTLERDRFPWQHKNQDLELYQRPLPDFGNKEPISIHYSGQRLENEKRDIKKAELDDWRSRIVVANPRQYFHRCLTETELLHSGYHSSNQLAKLQGLLKDSPTKFTLRRPGLLLQDIAPLGVVNDPSVDTSARREGLLLEPAKSGQRDLKSKGYNPGPYDGHSWSLERNKIPVPDYNHQMFTTAKGGDFNVYHRERGRLWQRPIYPLSLEERDNNLFPDNTCHASLRPVTPLDQKVAPLPPIKDQLYTTTTSALLSDVPGISQRVIEGVVN